MVNRVFLGRRGGSVLIGVSRPGVDVLSAGPADQLWRTDREVLRYGLQGTISVPGNSTRTVALGRSYARTPMIFVGMDLGNGGLRGPCNDFRVLFSTGDNRFSIINRLSGARTFYYLVYDNNVGSQSFRSVQQGGSWVFVAD